jgi:hypothetical protein
VRELAEGRCRGLDAIGAMLGGLLVAVVLCGCAGGSSRSWGEGVPRDERDLALAGLPVEAQRAFMPLSQVFYERIASRRFNSRATFDDPSVRQFFPSVAAYSDYYASLVDVLDRANVRNNQPTRIERHSGSWDGTTFRSAGGMRPCCARTSGNGRTAAGGSCLGRSDRESCARLRRRVGCRENPCWNGKNYSTISRPGRPGVKRVFPVTVQSFQGLRATVASPRGHGTTIAQQSTSPDGREDFRTANSSTSSSGSIR